MLDAKVTDPKVIVALDYDNHNEALAFVDRIEPEVAV